MASSAAVIPFPQQGNTAEVATSREAVEQTADLSRLKKQMTSAISQKVAENLESAEAERYYHAVQWTEAERKKLKDRGQPEIVYNRIKKKINTIVGILERLRQDPKSYPRNPNQRSEDGAEVCTKALLYALGWRWPDLSSTVARRGAIRGISGVELVVVAGDQGDPEIDLDEVDQREFFYDPRSTKWDFSDARYMGTTKMLDLDLAQATWPDYSDDLAAYVDNSRGLDSLERGDERALRWYDNAEKQVRIVDHWYMVGNEWHYAVYCNDIVLEEAPSPHRDEKRRSMCKFIMFSAEVDQDGDRYGFFRDWKGAQDEINHRRSKGLHALNVRRVVATKEAVDDVEKARREIARPDGWVEKNPGAELEIATNDFDAQGNLQLLQEAKSELDNYGPNPGLIGTQVGDLSGRAIQLLQAAGIAELGTFILAYKDWKLRVYRAVWAAVQQFWQEPRWIRVTDDEGMEQFMQVNGWERDEHGFPVVINQLAALDVDILIDEGPDAVNTMADTFDMMVNLAKGGANIPQEAIMELSPLPNSIKKRVMDHIERANQPKPMEEQAVQLKLQSVIADIEHVQSQTQKNLAQAQELLARAQAPAGGPVTPQVDTPADLAKAELDLARAEQIRSQTRSPGDGPGLFEVQEQASRAQLNQARADEARARAERARVQTERDMVTPISIPGGAQ